MFLASCGWSEHGSRSGNAWKSSLEAEVGKLNRVGSSTEKQTCHCDVNVRVAPLREEAMAFA